MNSIVGARRLGRKANRIQPWAIFWRNTVHSLVRFLSRAAARATMCARLSTAENHVLGIDIAPSAIRKAEALPKVAHEEYRLADLFDLPNELDGRFDWIFEHTCFCAIEPTRRRAYVETIVRLLKPGGKLLAIFFINPDHDESGPPYRVSAAELEEFFGRTFALEREWVPASTHPGREQRELMRILKRR